MSCNGNGPPSRFVAQLRTNAPTSCCPDDFLRTFTEELARLLKTKATNLIVELQSNVAMIRDGSMDRAMNIEIHHNSDSLNKGSKVNIAESIAKFMNKQLKIAPESNVMTLMEDAGAIFRHEKVCIEVVERMAADGVQQHVDTKCKIFTETEEETVSNRFNNNGLGITLKSV